MKKNYLPGLALLVAAAALPAVATAAGDAAAGKIKAFTCMGCHGIPGYNNVYPTYKVPKLGGQHAQYLVAALEAYKNGQRSHQTMQAQAQTLSEQDMQDIAAFFAQSGE
jgi:cytochrome c553